MFLVYKPEGGEEQRWLYNPGRLRTQEMFAIERHPGLKYGGEFKQALMQGATLARQALLWTFLRRDHPTIKFADVDFFDEELELQRDKDELEAEIAALEENTDLDETTRSISLHVLRGQLATAPYAPGKEPLPDPEPETAPVAQSWTQPTQSWPTTSEEEEPPLPVPSRR